MKHFIFLFVVLTIPVALWSQEKRVTAGGFIRSGVYLSTDDYEHNLNTVFGDAAFNLSASDNLSFKGFADLRARTGQQFGDNVSDISIREAWGMYYNDMFSFSAGKKIIKWGKTDFFTPLSKFNPTDYLYRSPDREDSDLGNLVAEVVFNPAPFFKLSFVTAPLWNPSVLMTTPLELPDYIKINLPLGFRTGNKNFSFGFRSEITIKSTDIGLQWYHGPDPMPGLALSEARLTNPDSIYIEMTGVPYNINSLGLDIESALSSVVLRGSVSLSKPVRLKEGNEEVPFPQIEWVGGLDWTPGSFRLTAEYSGKKVLDFYEPVVESLVGQDLDFTQLLTMLMMSGLEPVEFARLQTEGFNRLFNNQMKEYYHSAGIRVEYEAMYGKLIPSVSAVYNITTEDLVFMPKITFKPADGVTFSAGLEYYSGIDRSLYDIVEEFMSAAFFSLRIDF